MTNTALTPTFPAGQVAADPRLPEKARQVGGDCNAAASYKCAD